MASRHKNRYAYKNQRTFEATPKQPNCTVCGGFGGTPASIVLDCEHCKGRGVEPDRNQNIRPHITPVDINANPVLELCPKCEELITVTKHYPPNRPYFRITRKLCGCGLIVETRQMVNPFKGEGERTREFTAWCARLKQRDLLPERYYYLAT